MKSYIINNWGSILVHVHKHVIVHTVITSRPDIDIHTEGVQSRMQVWSCYNSSGTRRFNSSHWWREYFWMFPWVWEGPHLWEHLILSASAERNGQQVVHQRGALEADDSVVIVFGDSTQHGISVSLSEIQILTHIPQNRQDYTTRLVIGLKCKFNKKIKHKYPYLIKKIETFIIELKKRFSI